MYIDANTITTAAAVFGALGTLIGAIVAAYKVLETNKRQSVVIKAVQDEQTIICYGLRSVLQGMVEIGADGPCKEALTLLDKHLNRSAHQPDV